jgi:hypothetical protein
MADVRVPQLVHAGGTCLWRRLVMLVQTVLSINVLAALCPKVQFFGQMMIFVQSNQSLPVHHVLISLV